MNATDFNSNEILQWSNEFGLDLGRKDYWWKARIFNKIQKYKSKFGNAKFHC